MSAGTFEGYRPLLFSVAYRVLGSAADAEDAVQDAWVRWSAVDRSGVGEVKAYLVRIVTNLAMDRLRAARSRRESYPGPWLPEPIITESPKPGELADSVSTALLLLLENLSPLERAVFVLREAFGFSHAEIAVAVGRSEDTVRQAAYRARSRVRARRPRTLVDRGRHRAVTERFLAAAGGGDINVLMEMLAPDVTLWTDGGGKVRQAFHPVTGAGRVAAWFTGLGSRAYQGVSPAEMSAEITTLNGAAGILLLGGGRVLATLTLDLAADGRIAAIHNVANPEKLRAVATGAVHPVSVSSEQAQASVGVSGEQAQAPVGRDGLAVDVTGALAREEDQ
ncbi:RNA polymerase sigma-70 factor (ECF subfamily) [Actinoplanes couchii]|uniref:RNA polymerase sigma24 factor n=1 Tax=Actinoplanes couchii TaxID=403638 RepID=A0ABQ3XFS7_9ACTN|nr:RNA polymerase sigma factor SigJ [Actinoplanes couchii]MDR6321689.1 RNA polymerase sigma-70 factor (ECF subfamily) [Actinoplanes couchii]GID57355.1 RNA polymerase sigma24 factor [Actinoplanes couchii]